ncbi:MAG: hypothetical protein COW88_00855 [Candidatus Lloydbacteria bacterium CG22_combo_CG10-13_8_21_14_all_47_15]|uniref:Oxidoreductase n=1 Tax=Candidatus Lloydbacteria bacterium CG22_combo_CG10-13_8_21_14_all_47_15 TaxID=1974635 RepID=A0A2H0CV41_9BACT|nr:MAG: hypothetical protein COW88_00855 [Candidatus Lloydbacteria bacterium CG22_combo_CG10-13_8_21_14_all_47_15]
MKFLICGLGSIGKRMAENLEQLGYQCGEIGFYRTRKGTPNFGDDFIKSHRAKHPIFHDIASALRQKPEVVFVMNPTSLHIPTAIAAAEAGCHLFITKPLSHTIRDVSRLMELVDEKKLVTCVSYQLRFHPLLMQVKEWLDAKKIGSIVCVEAELSERITNLHPWEDYRRSYISRTDLGGGVILSFSHEIDCLYWLFGKPLWVFTSGGTLGNLGIDTEDVAKSIIQFPRDILASLHLDFLKKPTKRFLEITGEKGRIHVDYFGEKAELWNLDGTRDAMIVTSGYERNTMHLDELKHFLRCVENREQPSVNLAQGKDVLEICLAMKQSLQAKSPVPI